MRVTFLVLAVACAACHCRTPCDAQSCASGCCTGNVCETGIDNRICGTGGASCVDCLAQGNVCAQNACAPAVWLPPDSGPWFDAGFTSVPPTGLCSGLAQATCDWFQKCGRLDSAQVGDCLSLGVFGCAQPVYDVLADGGSQFDPARIAACLNTMAGSPCAGGSTPPGASDPICQHFAQGALVPDAGCPPGIVDVCQNGYCNGKSCPGTCTPLTPVGSTCVDHPECGPNGYCSGGSPRVCLAYKNPGDPCAPPDACSQSICDWGQGKCVVARSLELNAACSTSSSCGYGLYCLLSNGFPVGVCLSWVPEGGPCSGSGTECGTGLVCKGQDDAGGGGTCQPQSQLGQPCRPQTGDCASGLLCSNSKGCLAWQSLGQPCDPAVQNCRVGLWCESSTSLCALLPRIGQTCADSTGALTSCFDGQCDYTASHLCVSRQPLGGFCTTNQDCSSGYCQAKSYSCQPMCTSF